MGGEDPLTTGKTSTPAGFPRLVPVLPENRFLIGEVLSYEYS